MAYLHGDVVDGEHEVACDYEYARESRVLREAARLHRQGSFELEEIGEEIDQTFSCGVVFLSSPWLEIFICPHFPEIPWNSLPAEAHKEMVRAYPDSAGSLMADVRRLDGILDRLKELAVKARSQRGPPRHRALPILYAGRWTHALFTIDWSRTEAQLVIQFRSFLREHKERSQQHRSAASGVTGGAKDRLKDLAVWRLYEHLKGDWEAANAFAEEHRIQTTAGEPRPFHDLRGTWSPLFAEQSGFSRARRRAQAHFAGLFPWESREDIEALRAELNEAHMAIERAYIEAGGVVAEPLKDAGLPSGKPDLAMQRRKQWEEFTAQKEAELKRAHESREKRFRAFDPGI